MHDLYLSASATTPAPHIKQQDSGPVTSLKQEPTKHLTFPTNTDRQVCAETRCACGSLVTDWSNRKVGMQHCVDACAYSWQSHLWEHSDQNDDEVRGAPDPSVQSRKHAHSMGSVLDTSALSPT